MSYAFRAAGAATVGNNTTTGTVGLPAGTVSGDLLLAFLSVSTGGSGGSVPTISTPSGWTKIGSTRVNQSASAGIDGAWYYRWATGTDTGPSWSFGTIFKHAAVVVGYSGGPGTGTPALTSAAGASGTATTSNTAPTTSVTTPTWTAEFYSSRSTTNASYTTPSGTTLRASAFGSGGAAADLLVVDSGADVTGTDGGDTTTAGTSSSWSLSGIIQLPPLAVTSTASASLGLSAAATVTFKFPVTTPATASLTAAASSAGATSSVAASVALSVNAQPVVSPVAFVASSGLTGNGTTASAFNPAGISAGHLLIAHLTVATGGTGFTQPATPTPSGYTLLGTAVSQSATSGTVGAWYYRWATGSDTAPTIVLHASQVFKWTLLVTAHSGGDGTSAPPIQTGIDPQTLATAHTAETMTIANSTWIVTSYGIKSTTATTFSTPAGLTPLAEIFGTGGGAAASAVFDTEADVTGTVGGGTTSSDASSAYGVHATIAIPAQGGFSGQSAAASVSVTGNALTSIGGGGNSLGWGISYNNLGPAETALGRPVDFLRDYGGMGILPPMASNTALASKRRCIISMKFKTATITGGVPATDITSGKYNSLIDAFGRWLIGLPQCPTGPHIAVPEHEIDAAAAHNSGTDAQLNAAFAYTVARWRALPGWNCLIGTIVTGFNPTTREPLYSADYNISDVVGIDNPYINSYPGPSGDAAVGPTVDWFTANYPSMPLFIGEWGGLPGTGTQRANWITAFAAALQKPRYAKVIAATYWDNLSYALDAGARAAWAAAGQRSGGALAATATIVVTGAANTAFAVPATVTATVTVTGTANVTSSTGAVLPAAAVTLTGAVTVGVNFAVSATATADLLAQVSPPVIATGTIEGDIGLFASITATLTTSDAVGATGLLDLLASMVGPPVVARVIPVDVRVRINAAGGFEMDISTFVASVDYSFGRASALEATAQAGTATVVLDDTAGTFDPDNTASPLAGLLVPGPQSSTTLHVDEFVSALGRYVDLFTGGLESLERTFTGGDLSLTTGVFVDQTVDLSRHVPAAGLVLPAELPGARIARLVGLPSRTGFMWTSRTLQPSPTQLDRGQKVLGAVTCDGTTSSWVYATGAAAAEGGLLYFDQSGVLTFTGQQDRLVSAVTWNLGDIPRATPVEPDLMYRVSTDDMIVDVAVTTSDGATNLYGPGGASSVAAGVTFTADATETTQLAGWNSGASRAQYVYATRSVPRRNAPTVTLEVSPVIDLWMLNAAPTAYQVAVMGRVSDMVRLTRTPSGGGDVIAANYFIEGIHAVIDGAGTWTATLNLSRADTTPTGGFWKLGISRLGIDTTLTW